MREILLTQGQKAMVDDVDYERFSGFKFHAIFCVDRFYAASSRLGLEFGNILLHRVILNAPKGMKVDHRDGNSLNDMRGNLRLATHRQNMQNRKKHKCKNPYKGVYEVGSGRFKAMIFENSKLVTLGTFDTAEIAAGIYDARAKIIHGEFAHLNFQVLPTLFLPNQATQIAETPPR